MPDLPSLVIVGAGGLGREVAALVETINHDTPTWTLAGFVDDDDALQNDSVMGYPVLGPVDWLAEQENMRFVVAIGDGALRERVANRLDGSGVPPATLAHPSTTIHRTSQVGAGSVLCKGVAPTVNLHIGAHVFLNLNCTIGHDSILRPFVTLHPGVHISGSVQLGRGVSMGTGAVVIPDTTIGANTTVGAGAVVTEDLPANCTAVGTPARPLS